MIFYIYFTKKNIFTFNDGFLEYVGCKNYRIPFPCLPFDQFQQWICNIY